jgi:D-inositol-3-phosphate glycosyltransferase
MFHTLGEVKNRARFGEQEPASIITKHYARRATAIVTASSHERLLGDTAPTGDHAHRALGIDLELFQPRDVPAPGSTTNLPESAPVLLWVGRLEKLKGVEILVDAVAELERRDFTLLIVGGDERAASMRAELEAQAAAAGISANVRFEGAVSHDALPWYYSAADVCVVPSYYESFGLVAVEAMACGTPVVASRAGGLVSTVIDGVTGYSSRGLPGPFAEKLEVLLGNPEPGRTSAGSPTPVERFLLSTVGPIADVYDAARERHTRGRESRRSKGLARSWKWRSWPVM